MADQKQQSWLMQTFQNIFSAAFPQSDVEGVGMGVGDMGYDLTSTGGPISFDGDMGSPELSRSDLPAREITNIDGGYDALSRRQRYASYEQLEELIPEIHSSLNTYADEACSYDDENHVLQVRCSNEAVKEELEFLFFNSRTIDVDSRAWGMARNLCKYGDSFWELVIDPKSPQFGVLKLNELDPHTMWRIQSRKGTLLEFQQTMMSPDYDVVSKDIKDKHNKDNKPYQSLYWRGRTQGNKNLIRFAPAQVVHIVIGSEERGFKPYGISVLQPARRPAYNLRLMEDSMLLYRLSRGTERRVYYVDVGQMSGTKVDTYVEQFKGRTKRKRIFNEKTQQVDERFNPWSVDDDLYIPVRPNTNTRVDVLAGAQNLSDIDDSLYFRKKLFVALKIPQGYLEQTVEAATNRLSLTSLDMRFAKVVFRIQKAMGNAFREVAIRHLTLLGVPHEEFEDLEIIMTPSSEWREMAQSEVMQNRINLASSIKSMDVPLSDDWILERIFKLPNDEIDREKERKRRQEIERAELEGSKMLVAARYQAEIDRGNMVNQAALQQVSQEQMGNQGTGPDGQPIAPGQEGEEQSSIPTEDDLFAAAGEPNEEPELAANTSPGKAGAEDVPTTLTSPRARITKADIEADREP
jgi:hypothetical protein